MSKAIKVFISQAMKGKTEEEILTKRKEIEDLVVEQLRLEGKIKEDNDVLAEFIDSYFKDFNGNRLEFLGKSIQDCLAKADIAVFCDEWKNFDGCKCEFFIAKTYKIPVYQINKNIDKNNNNLRLSVMEHKLKEILYC